MHPLFILVKQDVGYNILCFDGRARFLYLPFDIQIIRLVSEWLLFSANSAIFQLYYGEKKLIYNEMMMRSAFFKTNELSWILIVLAPWNNSLRIDMSLHSDTWFWFRANRSLLLHLNYVCLSERQPIPIEWESEWVSGKSSEHFVSYIMTRISYISIRLSWYLLCTRSTGLVGFA